MNFEKCRSCASAGHAFSCARCDSGFSGFTPFKPKTNADHIRSMTDEELAEFLFEMQDIEYDHKGQPLDWLKQPYKEDT